MPKVGLGVTSWFVVLLSIGTEALSQGISQKTLGPCSPAIANTAGSVTVNCIFISMPEFVEYLQQNERDLRKEGDKGNLEAMRMAQFFRKKLANPEEAYVDYSEASRAYLKRLDTVQDKVGATLVRDAASGKPDAPQKIISSLANAGSPDVVAFALSLGDLLQAQGDLVGARTAYEQARLIAPTNGALLRRYSNLLCEFGKATEAIAMLETVLEKNEGQSKLANSDLAWIYAALGEALQNIGNLDLAEERFRFAKQLAGLAINDGAFNKTDFAWILNDSAGPAIRKKNFAAAEESLCRAVAAFSPALGVKHRDTIGAELNLTTVWREMGRWGDARASLEVIFPNVLALGSNDPLRGYFQLNLAQVEVFLSRDAAAKEALDAAYSFFWPRHEQFGAHSQRLGRIFHFRALMAFRNSDLSEAAAQARRAASLFTEAYGPESFDELTVDFLAILSFAELGDSNSASSLLTKFRQGMTRRRIDQDQTWISYLALLEASLEKDRSKRAAAQATIASALKSLFAIENTSNGYDPLADAGIFHVLRRDNQQSKRVTPSMVREFRLTHGARVAITTSSSKVLDKCILNGTK
jgi:tetratricopeptide (TPR) repeat protein